MAGLVKATRQISIDLRLIHVRPVICPVEALNRTMPPCIAGDRESGHHNLCPFYHRLRIYRGGTVYDIERTSDWVWWLMTDQRQHDTYEVICLRKESHGTEVGARLRP